MIALRADPAKRRWQSTFRIVLAALTMCIAAMGSASAQFSRDLPGAHPLAPPDTSSPRATLQSFMTAMNKAYTLIIAEADREDVRAEMTRASRCLDLGGIASEFRAEVGFEAATLLKEVLDRIDLPPPGDIPGDEEVTSTSDAEHDPLDEWTVPESEITIARVTEGPRKGKFLFDRETVANVHDYFERAKDLDYKDDQSTTPGIFGAYLYTPGPWLKRRWIGSLPSWLQEPIGEEAVWQWVGMGITLLAGLAVALIAFRVGRRWDRKRRTKKSPIRSGQIVAILLMLLIAYGAIWFIHHQIRITGEVLQVVTTVLMASAVALVGWLAAIILRSIGDSIIVSRRLRPKGIDSQLVRLTVRLLTIVVVIGLIFNLADRLGVPAYSVLTGLGVGGLAVALAARETLANFFGSVMIMLDRPFRVGDWIVVGDNEGTVEDIGFRSTRIRTFYNSMLSIPNAQSVNNAIDNMGMRKFRRVRTVLQVTYDTPVERLEAFVEGIREIIRAHPHTRKDYFHVVFNDFGAHSLDILVYFFLKVPDWGVELVERQNVFLDIIRLAERLEVKFAFPTRTLHVESLPGDADATLSDILPADQNRRPRPVSRQ